MSATSVSATSGPWQVLTWTDNDITAAGRRRRGGGGRGTLVFENSEATGNDRHAAR
ncbi:hypothetical protein K7G98_05495 [Saccharothrix sp. MB29]|nr:hypothetical protein [Saccharothrix sp. MB29]